MIEINEADVQLVLGIFKSHKSQPLDFNTVRLKALQAEPRITGPRIHDALSVLVEQEILATYGGMSWRFLAPPPSATTLASIAALIEEPHHATSSSPSTPSTGEHAMSPSPKNAAKKPQFKGMSHSMYQYMLDHANTTAAEVSKALKVPVNQVSVVLGSLYKRGWADRKELSGSPKRYAYTARATQGPIPKERTTTGGAATKVATTTRTQPRTGSKTGQESAAASTPAGSSTIPASAAAAGKAMGGVTPAAPGAAGGSRSSGARSAANNTLAAELQLISSVSSEIEKGLQAGIDPPKIRKGLEYALSRLSS